MVVVVVDSKLALGNNSWLIFPTCYCSVQTVSGVSVSSAELSVFVSVPVCSSSPGWRRRESRDPPGRRGRQPPPRRWRHPWWCQSGGTSQSRLRNKSGLAGPLFVSDGHFPQIYFMLGDFSLRQEEKTTADINKGNKSFADFLMLALTTSPATTCTILTLGWGWSWGILFTQSDLTQ